MKSWASDSRHGNLMLGKLQNDVIPYSASFDSKYNRVGAVSCRTNASQVALDR